MASFAETAHVYRTVMRNGSLRRALLAFLLFNAEEYAIWIAITLFAYEQGGVTTAGLVAVIQLVPAAVVAPLGSVIGDRMRRDRALALGYAIQATAALACALTLWFGPPITVYIAAVVSACAVTLTRPVHNAILPALANTPEELTASNSLSGTAEGIGIMLGPLLNSVLVVVAGLGAVCAAFAALMTLAALITVSLRLHAIDDDEASVELEGVLKGASAAAQELRRDPPAGILTLFGGAQFLVLGMLDIFEPVLAIEVLAIGQEGAGVLAAAVGVGGLVGAAATAILVGRTRLALPILLAVGATGVAMAAVSLAGALGFALILLALAGAARSFFDVSARTLLQRSVRAEILARVFGIQEALMMIGLAAGAALAPLLVSAFAPRGSFVAAGVILLASGILVLPALRALDRRANLPDPERISLLRSLDLFRPLPQPALEQVASKLIPLEVPSGRSIIREGEAGDRFYVLVEGAAVVALEGRELSALGPGDFFGEIALLRDVPRTATVTMTADSRLLALERDDFLAAVGGSRLSATAADEEVARRLARTEQQKR